MALLLMEGFDGCNTNMDVITNVVASLGSAAFRSASRTPWSRQDPNSQSTTWGGAMTFDLMQTSTADIAVGIWIRVANEYSTDTMRGNSNFPVFYLHSGDSDVVWNDGTNLDVITFGTYNYTNAYIYQNYWWSNSSTYKQRQFAGEIWDGEWHFLQFRYKADNSAGISHCQLDEEVLWSVSGEDTILGTSPPTFGGMNKFGFDFGASTNPIGIGGIIIYDDATSPTGCLTTSSYPLSPCRIKTLRPNASGNYSQWDYATRPYSGAWQTHVANRGSEMKGRISTTTADSIDTYGFENLTTSPTIKAVAVTCTTWSTGSNTAYLKGVARSSGTDSVTSSFVSPGHNKYMCLEIPYDPNTTAAWGATGLNAAEFGVKYTTS